MEKEQIWLPLQTVYNKELTVAAYLKEQGIEHYIPMTYELRDTGREGECTHILVPAIHNLIFIHRPYEPTGAGSSPPKPRCPSIS